MKLNLKNVRLSFPELWRPKAFEGGKPSYSAAFILPPDHPQIAEVNKAITAVATEKWADKAPVILKGLRAGDKVCIHNGDLKAQYDGYAGNFYITSRSATKPLILDKDKTILDESDGKPYGGCYVIALLEVWAQDHKQYGKRVNTSLKGIQFLRDGDAFSGSAPAQLDDFDEIGDTGEDELA